LIPGNATDTNLRIIFGAIYMLKKNTFCQEFSFPESWYFFFDEGIANIKKSHPTINDAPPNGVTTATILDFENPTCDKKILK
jgi:hypothetical protein